MPDETTFFFFFFPRSHPYPTPSSLLFFFLLTSFFAVATAGLPVASRACDRPVNGQACHDISLVPVRSCRWSRACIVPQQRFIVCEGVDLFIYAHEVKDTDCIA